MEEVRRPKCGKTNKQVLLFGTKKLKVQSVSGGARKWIAYRSSEALASYWYTGWKSNIFGIYPKFIDCLPDSVRRSASDDTVMNTIWVCS